MTFGNSFIEITIYPEDYGRFAGIMRHVQQVAEDER